jgi:hypothetical protein
MLLPGHQFIDERQVVFLMLKGLITLRLSVVHEKDLLDEIIIDDNFLAELALAPFIV